MVRVETAAFPAGTSVLSADFAVFRAEDVLLPVERAVLRSEASVPFALLPSEEPRLFLPVFLSVSVLRLPEAPSDLPVPALSLPARFVLLFLLSGILPPRTGPPCPNFTVTFYKNAYPSMRLLFPHLYFFTSPVRAGAGFTFLKKSFSFDHIVRRR